MLNENQIIEDHYRFKLVNHCETLEELANTIELFANADGSIHGRSRMFNAKKMADYCRNFESAMEYNQPNVLTRSWGIRQQAMHIYYYMSQGSLTVKPYVKFKKDSL